LYDPTPGLLPALAIRFPEPAKLIGGSLEGDEKSNSRLLSPQQGFVHT
jgi:hypothetical protein